MLLNNFQKNPGSDWLTAKFCYFVLKIHVCCNSFKRLFKRHLPVWQNVSLTKKSCDFHVAKIDRYSCQKTGDWLPCWTSRGGSRGRVQRVRTPPWDDLRLSNTTGILQKKCGLSVLVTPFLSGAPPPKKNPGSAPDIDYKIATKCIAKRLEKALPMLIDRDLTGYVKNRFIGENIH